MTALFWDRLRDLLEEITENPRQGELLETLLKECTNEDTLVEAGSDRDGRGVMLERGYTLRTPGKELDAETQVGRPDLR